MLNVIFADAVGHLDVCTDLSCRVPPVIQDFALDNTDIAHPVVTVSWTPSACSASSYVVTYGCNIEDEIVHSDLTSMNARNSNTSLTVHLTDIVGMANWECVFFIQGISHTGNKGQCITQRSTCAVIRASSFKKPNGKYLL